ncbi:hypothetical protein [Azospirillum sp. sgz302134]
MSSRAIVSLGVWILAMVLVGTMTVGFALVFYVALTAFFAVVVAVMMMLTRRRDERQQGATWTDRAAPASPIPRRRPEPPDAVRGPEDRWASAP